MARLLLLFSAPVLRYFKGLKKSESPAFVRHPRITGIMSPFK